MAIEVEKTPNNVWFNFMGQMTNLESNKRRYRLDVEHLMLRDQRLKSTKFCVGVVVYAGEDTKTMLNQDARVKRYS